MGKRGPRSAPTALRVLSGEPHQDRINRDDPLSADGLPEPPEGLSEEAVELWDYTVGQLAAMGRCRRGCAGMFLRGDRAAQEGVGAVGEVVGVAQGPGEGKWVRIPLVQIQRDAAVLIRAFAQEFGLTRGSLGDQDGPVRK